MPPELPVHWWLVVNVRYSWSTSADRLCGPVPGRPYPGRLLSSLLSMPQRGQLAAERSAPLGAILLDNNAHENRGPMAELLLSRPLDAGGLLRRIWVKVDGQRVAGLRPGQSARVSLDGGEHVVHATLDWIRSEPLALHLDADETTSLEVSCPARAYLQMLFKPSRALDLRRS
ncbi:hypothetical protein ABZ422_25085 [Micromonospora zamorensis]|uniref:hypothetical protein n=1 Tax=Micromonospora zamorensis TaxID=709883 RepID=UPI002E175D08